ncbi:MAG: hypothetical protein WEB57_08800 [Pseudohongiellaceae bacterium]
MPETIDRECLLCGMRRRVPVPDYGEDTAVATCIKCDSALFRQSDGSTLTVDIAHHRETVAQALEKMDQALNAAWQGYEQDVRLVVGGGAIREAVLGELTFQDRVGRIVRFRPESPNRGAVRVTLRDD